MMMMVDLSNSIVAPKKVRSANESMMMTTRMKDVAQSFGPEAIRTLLEIMRNGTSESVRVAAAKELLDRGFGKAQVMDLNEGASIEPPVITIVGSKGLKDGA